MSTRVINVDEAVEHIYASVQLAEENDQESPYFFIAGAGISYPEVPVASEIIAKCKEKVKERSTRNPALFSKFVDESETFRTKGMKYYSFWISKAYPNKADRSTYFKSLITKSRISSATLLLAQVLYWKNLATTVFTPNFDENLEKALNMFGVEELFTADNPRDNLALETDGTGLQIAHLHGTYRFYDCANLECEIEERTSESDISSSAFALRKFLTSKAPIIVGYSGWEGDVIMQSISERIKHPIPYDYVWICYCKNDFDNLPNWLKECNSILFVVPEDTKISCDAEHEGSLTLPEDKGKDNVISAYMFFGKIISKFGIDPPTLFSNPSLYFSDLVRRTLPDNSDVFHLKRWADRMKTRAQSESESDKVIEQLELASAKKDYISSINFIDILSSDTTLGASDYVYVFDTIITQLINDEEMVSDSDCRIHLHASALAFVLEHMHDFATSNTFHAAIKKVSTLKLSNIDCKKTSTKELYIRIADSTRTIIELLPMYLEALGVLSSCTEDKEESKGYINEIINASKNVSKSDFDEESFVDILITRSLALLNMAHNTEEYAAKKEILSKVKSIVRNLKNNYLELKLIREQARLGEICPDDIERKRIVTTSIRASLLYDRRKNCRYILDVFDAALRSISRENYQDYSRVLKQVEAILDELLEQSISESGCLVSLINVVVDFIKISPNQNKMKIYAEYVVNCQSRLQELCISERENQIYNFNLSLAINFLCSLAVTEMDDTAKSKYLLILKQIRFEEDEDTFRPLYLLSLYEACENGDREVYIKNGFADDLDLAEKLLSEDSDNQ